MQNKQKEQQKNNSLQPRPPVVVVMGHVDHGKTSILDYIRKAHVAEKESGGITQHIGAYEAEYGGKKITFIDTPGHEAFSAMRSRGAKAADIAILVVAADAGIQPQTKEAILHIKQAGIPMIVALNKIDKPEAQPEKIKRELAQQDVLLESMGGKIPSVEVSAKTGKGVNELLEMILLVADLENLSSDTAKQAEGVIIESYLDSLKGPTATLILREGALKPGDIVATQSTIGKIKSLQDFLAKEVDKALPSMPVIALGFESAPKVGERLKVFASAQEAQEYVERKEQKAKDAKVFFVEPGKKVLNLILKADVLGSLEAIEGVIKDIPQEKVILRTLKSEVGDISEADVKLAESSKATIFGFRVKKNSQAENLADKLKVRIFIFNIIYDLIQGVRSSAERILEPEILKIKVGKIKILAVFHQEKNKQIIGGKIIEGEARPGLKLEVFRKEEKIGQGKIAQLQKNKVDVEKCIKNQECGILFEGNAKVEEDDVLEIYEEKTQKSEL